MRGLHLLAGASVLAILGLGQPVLGGSLSAAQLEVELGTMLPAVFPASGPTGSATGPSAASLGAGTAFNGVRFRTLPEGGGLGLAFSITTNDAGSFSGSPLAGTARFRGNVLVNLFGAPTLPLAIGAPAGFSTAVGYTGFFDTIAINFGAWTAGTTTVFSVTRQGSNAIGANGVGQLVLVSPIAVSSNTTGNVAGFGILTLTYVPEPGTALLLGWGAVCLGLYGRRRRG